MTTLPDIDQAVDEGIEQLIADLYKARNYVAEGWMKHSSGFAGQVCAVGALRKAIGGHPIFQGTSPNEVNRLNRAVYALSQVLGVTSDLDYDHLSAVFSFNDNDITVKDDVIGLFNTTIRRLGG